MFSGVFTTATWRSDFLFKHSAPRPLHAKRKTAIVLSTIVLRVAIKIFRSSRRPKRREDGGNPLTAGQNPATMFPRQRNNARRPDAAPHYGCLLQLIRETSAESSQHGSALTAVVTPLGP
jgi:hypothetical protein